MHNINKHPNNKTNPQTNIQITKLTHKLAPKTHDNSHHIHMYNRHAPFRSTPMADIRRFLRTLLARLSSVTGRSKRWWVGSMPCFSQMWIRRFPMVMVGGTCIAVACSDWGSCTWRSTSWRGEKSKREGQSSKEEK